MTIRVVRNNAGNCVNFVGTSNPAYWNACLSAQVNVEDGTRIDIVNDIRSQEAGEVVYEFYAVPFSDFSEADGTEFATAQDAADYITAQANVAQTQGSFILSSTDVLGFELDATQTSIVLSNGDSFGVNTIQALNTGDGLITIKRIGDEGTVLFTGLDHTNAQINGASVAGGLNDVINTLNELFTVGPFEAVVIADPYSTMVADVAGDDTTGALVGTAINPASSDIGQGTQTGYNYGGWLSNDTIDQAGEYFSFDIRTEGIIGMGLVHTDAANINGNTTYGNPDEFCDGSPNSGHYGYQFSHWFHPSPNGPWTNYGANSSSYSQREGWSGTNRFSASPEGQDWLDGNPVKMRVGLDNDSFISIDYYDVSEASWIPIARTTYPSATGTSYKLGIKFGDTNVKLFSLPKVHLLDPVAPTLYYRWIESPDNNFYYPLFASEAEANYVSPDGLSHTHTFADDPTNTTWYMPTGGTHDGTAAPTGQNYTEITSLTDSDLTPSQFSSSDYTYQEGTVVNLQLYPAGASFTQSVDITPTGSGLVYNTSTGYLQGTLADVASDTTYTVTVTRANSYGSTVGTFEIVSTNIAPVNTQTTPWTKALDFSGSNEHLSKQNNGVSSSPLQMNGDAVTVSAPATAGNTSADTNAKPWATAIVFKYDGNASNQHIWNQGEGAASGDDNIYLRLDATGWLYFGWGRQGALNECKFIYLGRNTNTYHWHGIYIAHNGTRLSGSNATAANLASAFDIRWFSTNFTGGVFGSWMDNKSTEANWTAGSTGGRMDRTVTGTYTIGGRGGNRNFHGKVASAVVTTLRRNVAMPTDAEIEEMMTDPVDWIATYKTGQTYRPSSLGGDYSNFSGSIHYYHSQVWLMGDGATDSYANGIRNELYPSEAVYTKLTLNSMVSNDIENVTISGLT